MPKKREDLRAYLDSIKDQLYKPLPLDGVNETQYDLVFYPGCYGPMENLGFDPVSGALLQRRFDSVEPLALLCRAPVAILATKYDDATDAFSGRAMTGLSNMEEKLNFFAWKTKWYLQDTLVEASIDCEKGLIPLRPYVVVEYNFYTDGNPQSADALVTRTLKDFAKKP